MKTQEAQETEKSASKNDLIASASAKLSRKSVDVTVYRNLTAIQSLESTIMALKESAEISAAQQEQIAIAEQQVEALKKDVIVGTLVPLRVSDIFLIQGLVTETALNGRKMGFDDDVQLFVMLKAERCGTVYFSLRRCDNHKERYFTHEEDAAMLDDRTLSALTRLYADSFVLTEEERKNS